MTKITFDTEQFDTNSNFASGTYTAPVAGFYQFNWRVKTVTSGAETLQTALYKNGAAISVGGYDYASTQHITSSGADFIQVAAGDTFDVYSVTNAARAIDVGATACYFSGFLVSRT